LRKTTKTYHSSNMCIRRALGKVWKSESNSMFSERVNLITFSFLFFRWCSLLVWFDFIFVLNASIFFLSI
jgi:hypothetical protein